MGRSNTVFNNQAIGVKHSRFIISIVLCVRVPSIPIWSYKNNRVGIPIFYLVEGQSSSCKIGKDPIQLKMNMHPSF
jgi:hypothetical protein